MITLVLSGALVLLGAMYGAGFVLRAFDSEWLRVRMWTFFPLLEAKVDSKPVQLAHFAAWTVVLPVLGVALWRSNDWVLLIVLALNAWEVYLGATFYVRIGDWPGARLHMVLHSVVGGMVLSRLLGRFW